MLLECASWGGSLGCEVGKVVAFLGEAELAQETSHTSRLLVHGC